MVLKKAKACSHTGGLTHAHTRSHMHAHTHCNSALEYVHAHVLFLLSENQDVITQMYNSSGNLL